MSLAKLMIAEAKLAGADAVKFQYYNTDEIVKYEKSQPTTLYTEETFMAIGKAEFSLYQIKQLMEYANENEIDFICTPFLNPEHVDELNSIGLKIFKIRERDSTNYALIDRALETGARVIISSRVLPLHLNYLYHPRIDWIYCVPKYPPKDTEMNLEEVIGFNGISDHSQGIVAALGAATIARVYAAPRFIIEKHFMLEGVDCIDKEVSITPPELETLVTYVKRLELMVNPRPAVFR